MGIRSGSFYILTVLILLSQPISAVAGDLDDTAGEDPVVEISRGSGPWNRTEWTRYRNMNDAINEMSWFDSAFPDICRMYNLSDMFRYPNGSSRYTGEGRTFWGLKISDNPSVNESDEPEVLYISMTHAREWISLETLMYYINYLLRNYGFNSTVNDVVNKTEMWFIPIVNPDGFQESIDRDDYNNSFGLAGWRKNKNESNGIDGFQNYGSAFGDGVDPNRNFGYMWGGPGAGTDPEEPTYRGSGPFSEPETQLIRDFAESRNFSSGLSFHSYSQVNLFPWGHTSDLPPDYSMMNKIATRMSDFNGYIPIQGSTLYPTNGDFTDYMYGTFGIPAFTIELDTVFIPPVSRIANNTLPNLEVSFLLARIAEDPYMIFESGLNGRVSSYKGIGIQDARIRIRGNGREINLTSDGSGNFLSHLEPGFYDVDINTTGGLFNTSEIYIPNDRYVDIIFTVVENIPPVVDDVSVFSGSIEVSSIERGEEARLVVTEASGEKELRGWVNITSTGDGYSLTRLPLEEIDGGYEAVWDTNETTTGHTYSIDTVLEDPFGNQDLDGMRPGPDREVTVIDTTPPGISKFAVSGSINGSGPFERGQILYFKLNVDVTTGYEDPLDGEVHVAGAVSRTLDISWIPGTENYSAAMETGDLPLGSYDFNASVRDPFGNEFRTGKESFVLIDTIPPEFSLDLADTSGRTFRSNEKIGFVIDPDEDHGNLTPYILIMDGSYEEIDRVEEFEWDEAREFFRLEWDPASAHTGTYYAEGRLRDEAGNLIETGEHGGMDASFKVRDAIPPMISSVMIDGSEVGPGDHLEVYGGFEIEVVPGEVEIGLFCRLLRTAVNGALLDAVMLEKGPDGHFRGEVNEDNFGLGTLRLEIELKDSGDNIDPDGFGEGVDLIVDVFRPPVEITALSVRVMPDDLIFGSGETVWKLSSEKAYLEFSVVNMSDGDGLTILIDGRETVGTPDIHIDNDSRSCSAELHDLPMGYSEVWFEIRLNNGSLMRSRTITIFTGSDERESIDHIAIGSTRETGDGSFIVDLVWEAPPLSSHLLLYTGHGIGKIDPEDITPVRFDRGSNGTSVTVGREVTTFLVVVVYYPFPEGAGRNVTFMSWEDEGQGASRSSVTFYPPMEEETTDDGSNGTGVITAVILSVIMAVVLIGVVVVLFFRSTAGKKGDEEGSGIVESIED